MARIPKPSRELGEALRRESVVLRAFQLLASGVTPVQAAKVLRIPTVILRRWMASYERSGGNVQSLWPRKRRLKFPLQRIRKPL
jgi:hypothetical protein